MFETTERAAEVTRMFTANAMWGPFYSVELAQALAAAGLLADPTGSRTDAEQAVIDAAKVVRSLREVWIQYPPIRALCAAVDRLTATEEAT